MATWEQAWRHATPQGMRSRLTIAALVIVALQPARATGEECPPFDHDHSAFTKVLTATVRGEQVNYTALAGPHRGALAAYAAALTATCAADYLRWSRPQRLAFWINAYNAFTLQLIVEHHPVNSIRKIGWLPGTPFNTDFIDLGHLFDAERGREPAKRHDISLDDIEHRILRKRFVEPRIHFAINCASVSCPALQPAAWRAVGLDARLEAAAHAFLRDARRNRVDRAAKVVHLSKIFKWFGEDFVRAAGSVTAYASRYFEGADRSVAATPGVTVEFLDYDWSLNGR